ncbi:MAG: MauE/DoxX family redox-associated membrane protein [Myxococcota bacterium]
MSPPLTMDPALGLVLRLALGLLLVRAATHKLAAPAAFHRALRGYRLLPEAWTVPAAAALVVAELTVATGLGFPATAAAATGAALGLLGLYSAAIAINLARGRRSIDCGCLGPGHRQPLGPELLARNGALMTMALMALLPTAARPLVWLDGVTVSAGVATLGLLYLSAEIALQSAPARGIWRVPR